MRRSTIYDIAKITNTSAATVSRVLSNSSYPVSQELCDKIRKAAKELNYIPNMIGRQLKTSNSMSIGVIVPSISNPFYSAVVLGIEQVARRNGYHLLLCNSRQSPQLETEYLQTLVGKEVSGLVISSISADKEQLQDYIAKGLHVVFVDQALDDINSYQILFDYRKGGYVAVNYLLQQGHQKIAYVTAPLDRPSRINLYMGYQDALREAGIELDPALVHISHGEDQDSFTGIYEFQNGKTLAKELLDGEKRPTAIFTCNDMTAFGVMNELNARGVKIPEDISVFGFDDIEIGQMVTPSLSTIEQPKYEMGELACKMLLDWINGEKVDITQIVLQPRLIERDSVAKIL